MINKNKLTKIETHNFEISKNKLKKFSEQTQTDFELNRVKNHDDIDILKWFDHGVTGKELNELTSQIQGHLIDVNKTQVKIIREFGEVYNTFESLDKDYISAILLSIEGIKKTNERIEQNIYDIGRNQEDIKQILDIQKNTITKMIEFKNRIEGYKIDEDTELKLKKLKRTVLISNISFGIITILLFSLFFMGSK